MPRVVAIAACVLGFCWPIYAGEVTWYACFRYKDSLERVLPAGVGLWNLGLGAFRQTNKLPPPKFWISSEWDIGECPGTDWDENRQEQWDTLSKPLNKEVYFVAPSDLNYLPKGDPYTAVRRAVVRIWPRFTNKNSDIGSVSGQAGTGFVVKRTEDTVWIATARHVIMSSDGSKVAGNVDLEFYSGILPPGWRSARISVLPEQLLIADIAMRFSINELTEKLKLIREKIKNPNPNPKVLLALAKELAILSGLPEPGTKTIQSAEAILVGHLQIDESRIMQALSLKTQIARKKLDDVILFEVPAEDVPIDIRPLQLSMTIPEGTVNVVGHPGNRPPWSVVSLPLLETNDSFLIIDGGLEPGASGSPVLDASSQVVGLVFETTSYAGGSVSHVTAYRSKVLRESLENSSQLRENTCVTASSDWVHGQQAARIR